MIEDDAKGGVRSVEVALNVLEAVAFSGDEVGVTQVAERLKLTKGSVHRHLITLSHAKPGHQPIRHWSPEPVTGASRSRFRPGPARRRSHAGAPRSTRPFRRALGIDVERSADPEHGPGHRRH